MHYGVWTLICTILLPAIHQESCSGKDKDMDVLVGRGFHIQFIARTGSFPYPGKSVNRTAFLADQMLTVWCPHPKAEWWFKLSNDPTWLPGLDSPPYLDGTFEETKRYMDFATPGSQAKEGSLFGLEAGLEGIEPGYPGGPLLNPLGLAKDIKMFMNGN